MTVHLISPHGRAMSTPTSTDTTTAARSASSPPMHESHLPGLERLHQGKVRDIYAIPGDPHHMLIVTTDRLSAFDVVLPDPIPGKGRVLTSISNFWFERTTHIVPNHLAAPERRRLDDIVPDAAERALIADRSMVVRRLKALPVEAVVRGYLIGSGWKDYQATDEVCGIRLPTGLRMADKLPQPIFTPATKAPKGHHDENVGFGEIVKLIGEELAVKVRDTAIALYEFAARHALERGIIIADTKFEFGVDEANGGRLTLIDEALTPDSSRFWPVDTYAPGTSPPSFDKQFVRDYLETLDWNKTAPGPKLPAEVIRRTSEKYEEALRRLTA
jgi:phosphoribosylaminoimidazole-succinocarboxamide synthase